MLQRPDTQSLPLMQDWPLVERQALPTSCVVPAGQRQLLVAEFQTDPAGDWQTHPCDPYPWIDDVEPVGHAVQGGFPLMRSK